MLGLPWGAGTGIVRADAQPGVVFCMRVADHDRPMFRYVPLVRVETGYEARRLDGVPEVLSQLLTCLDQADPRDPHVQPDLPADLLRAVFDVWPLAQGSVYDDWMERTDPRSVEPRVPKVMRDAAALVRRHGSFLGDVQDTLVDRFGQDVETRIQRQVRDVLRENADDPAAAVGELRRLADDLRLPVPKPVEPLPEIEVEDVRLVAWVAVHDGSSSVTTAGADPG